MTALRILYAITVYVTSYSAIIAACCHNNYRFWQHDTVPLVTLTVIASYLGPCNGAAARYRGGNAFRG